LKARESFESSAAVSLSLEPLVVNLENRERSLDKFGDWRSPLDVEDGERSLGGSEAVGQSCRGRMIPNRKILQTAVPIQADAAGSDSSQWHRDLGGFVAGESALRST
jgi:hypothetical protein